METVQATRLRPGMVIQHQGSLYSVFSLTHRTPGNKRGFVQTKLRDLRSGAMIEHRFSSEEFVERAFLDEKEVEFLYHEDDVFTFMDTSTYEQYSLSREVLGDTVGYLTPNCQLKVEFFEGRPIGLELPPAVELKVVETEPGIKGASATNVMKPAKLETGITVQVPPFISEGEVIRVDTADGTYLERAR
ncbi:MAG: elongation factor P [Acidobacteria bacterium]|nr:elongation factor P [Acidobacteriota bacterium]